MLIVFLGAQVIEAKTPQAVVGVEGEDARVDARYGVPALVRVPHNSLPSRMLKDDRVKAIHKQSVLMFDDDDFVDRLG